MKKLFIYTFVALSIVASPSVSHAAIDVLFETTPLFGQSNYLPGDTTVKKVTVTNTGAVSEQVYTELLNVFDGGLAPMMTVKITNPSTLFNGSFDDLDDAGEQFLTSILPGETKVYTFAMHFLPQAGNEYQLKSLGFDICVGFSGGQFECDTTDDPGAPGGGGGNGNSNSGGGSSSGPAEEVLGETAPTPLILGNQVSVIPTGAPNTGAGGVKFLYLAFFLFIICVISLRWGQYVYVKPTK